MWFKILPGIGVMASLMQRDRRISGVNHYYMSKGLENIH
ncbi:unnamed protein product [Nyctereutes procyonoides]|uniref:(raccoon dog) hypothetical protein n=1 Tax=Nyctereutes procyonoides TaxID=34880 RepID=A0A811XYZ3_NYCPR|nr:unnamed protein product [Nyctereutes procyonoides]